MLPSFTELAVIRGPVRSITSVLPKACTKRVSIEAGVTDLWWKYVGTEGKALRVTESEPWRTAQRIAQEGDRFGDIAALGAQHRFVDERWKPRDPALLGEWVGSDEDNAQTSDFMRVERLGEKPEWRVYRPVGVAQQCVTCHGVHAIKAVKDPQSPVHPLNVNKTCATCHSSAVFMRNYNPGLPIDQEEKYKTSVHGMKHAKGDMKVAVCSSCHGSHDILKAVDAKSHVNAANLPVTCGKCHPGATANFASGNIHVGAGGTGGVVKYWVEKIYIWLIVVVIGGMVVHNGFDYFRKMQALYRRRREWEHPGYERLNRSERVQHVLTFTTFIALVITGFALKFKWSLPFLSDAANVALRGVGHRVAAVLMVATSVYHLFYAAFTARGRGQVLRMLPRWKDVGDITGTLRYYFGLADHKPKFDRFSYVEKAEYLALVWGTIVMVVTGFLLWFQDEALKHIPMWGLDVATLVHYYEAILATLAIIVWHLYYVFVNPDFAPMSFTWIDGKLSRHDMEHEHALELEEIDAFERRGEPPPPDVTRIATEEE